MRGIREGWVEAKLGDILVLKNGYAFKSSKYQDKGIPVIRISDINNEAVKTDHSKMVQELEEYDNYVVSYGDILIAMSGATTGKFGIFRGTKKVYQNQCVGNLKLYSDIFCNKVFIYYLLYSLKRKIEEDAYGGAQPNISGKKIQSLLFNFPPLPEQRAIVSKIEQCFSELDNGIAHFKTAQKKLDIYRQAVLKKAFEGELTKTWREQQNDLPTADELLQRIQQERQRHYQQQITDWEKAVKDWEMGGKDGRKPRKPPKLAQHPVLSTDELSILPKLPNLWRYMRLSEIAKIGSGMSVSKSRKLKQPFEVAYLRVANVQRGALSLDEIKTMPIEEDTLKNMELKKWDILFNEGGDRDKLGRGWIWESQISPCITQNHVFRASLYFSSDIFAKFISYWGNTFGKDYFERTGKQTTNLASINKTVLSMFPVPFPSFQEQAQIVQEIESRLSVCDKLADTLKQQLEKAEALRQSILKKAFEGRLLTDAEIQACQQEADWEPAEQLLARIKAESAEKTAAKPRKKQARKRAN